MRCKNCGWENPNNANVCAKCNMPLEPSQEPENNTAPSSARDLKKTVMESSVFDLESNSESSVQDSSCPKCGYPLRTGVTRCPNCNYVVSNAANDGSQPTVREVQKTPATIKQHAINETVNPYLVSVEEPLTFTLKPISRINERREFGTVEYEGEHVALNRDNLEEGNPTISSSSQAQVCNKEGVWYIKDLSDQGTTFVQAKREMPLNDGDIILIGNRLFEFHC